MKNAGTFLTELQSGALNGRMIEIYGCDPDKAQGYADRFAKVIKGFQVTFPKNAQAQIGLYSAPGRTEIGGNHTDHQYGCVLAASVNLDAIAAAALNGTNVIRFYSEGYGMIEAQLMGISWGAMAGAFLAPFLYGLYWRKTTTFACWVNFIFSVGFMFANMLVRPALPKVLQSPINAGAFCMLIGLVIVPVVSVITPKPDEALVADAFSSYSKKVLVQQTEALSDEEE